jgi:hypothetical protein
MIEVDEDSHACSRNHIPGAAAIDWKADLQAPLRRDFVDQAAFDARSTSAYPRLKDTPMTQPSAAPPPRPRKHLMDPNNPRPPQRYSTSLSTVQTWVLSTLAVTTILHLSAGLVVAGLFADRIDAKIGLLVIGGLFGVVAVAAGLAIHRRPLLSWWLLLGWIPAIVGAYIAFR